MAIRAAIDDLTNKRADYESAMVALVSEETKLVITWLCRNKICS